MAEKAGAAQARVSKARGMAGTVIMGGEIEGVEHNRKLGRQQWLGETGDVGIVQKMRLTNPQVQALLLAVKLPLLAADYTIEPADAGSVDGLSEGQAEEQARTARAGFFETTIDEWRATLGHALLHIDFGFALLEKEWEVNARGTYGLRRFAPRLPQTVIRWLTKGGEFAGVRQRYFDSDASTFEEADIPAENLILLTHGREGNNFAGVSLLRPVWALHELKTMLLKLLSIAFEREALGIPIATVGEGGASTEQLDDVAALLENLRAHQKQYGILPHGFEVDWYFNSGGAASRDAILSAVRYIDEQILHAGLAQFIGLGSTATGSRAVASEQTDLFWMVENGIAAHMASAFSGVGRGPTSGVLRQLAFLNHGEQSAYPYMKVSGIEANSLGEFSESLQRMGGFITADDVMEEFVRAKVGAPQRVKEPRDTDAPKKREAPREQRRSAVGGAEEEDKSPAVSRVAKGDADKDPVKATELGGRVLAEPGGFAWIPPRPLEGAEVHVRFAELVMYLDTAPGDTVEAVIDTIEEHLAARASKLNKAVAAGAVGRVPSKLPGLGAAIAGVLRAAIDRATSYGAQTVEDERRRQRRDAGARRADVRRFADGDDPIDEIDEEIEEEIEEEIDEELFGDMKREIEKRKKVLDAQAEALAEELEGVAVARMRTEALGAIRRREPGFAIERAIPGTTPIKRGTVGLTATAVNVGRDEAGAMYGEELQSVRYSAVMDVSTCPECAAADQQAFAFGSDEHLEHECPYAQCEGGAMCRCILVYEFKGAK